MPLSEEQLANFNLQFLLLDYDSDGVIPISDLGRFLRSTGFYPTSSDLRALSSVVDPHNTGIVKLEDILATSDSYEPFKLSDAAVREAFKAVDEDQDGYLTAAQLRHVLTNLGDQLSNEEADEVLRDALVDGDSQMNIDDLITMLLDVKPIVQKEKSIRSPQALKKKV